MEREAAMESTHQIPGALFEINARWESLSESEKRVASYVVQNPKKVLHLNVRELAKQSTVHTNMLCLIPITHL